MAASKGKGVQQPPQGDSIMDLHVRRATSRFSCRAADLQAGSRLIASEPPVQTLPSASWQDARTALATRRMAPAGKAIVCLLKE